MYILLWINKNESESFEFTMVVKSILHDFLFLVKQQFMSRMFPVIRSVVVSVRLSVVVVKL